MATLPMLWYLLAPGFKPLEEFGSGLCLSFLFKHLKRERDSKVSMTWIPLYINIKPHYHVSNIIRLLRIYLCSRFTNKYLHQPKYLINKIDAYMNWRRHSGDQGLASKSSTLPRPFGLADGIHALNRISFTSSLFVF